MKMQPFLKDPMRRLKRLVRQSSKWPIGYAIIAGVLVIRWLGLFSHLELLTLDFLLRNRLPESLDEEVVIVLFNVNTVQSQSGLDEPTEEQLAQLLKIIFFGGSRCRRLEYLFRRYQQRSRSSTTH